MSLVGIASPISNYTQTFVQYQTSSKSVETDSQGIAEELKTKLFAMFFCVGLHKELAEDDKPRHTPSRFVTT